MAKGSPKIKEKPQLREPEARKELDSIVYWTTLLVLATANLFAAVVMIPLMLLASSLQFYLIIALIAMLFGYVFSMLIARIEHIGIQHHVMAVIFIPAVSLATLIVISNSTRGIAMLLNVESGKDPLIVSLFYTIFFLLPHLLHISREKLLR